MDYGHPPHVASSEDLTILYCYCGWQSKELSLDEKAALGVPWYCGECNRQNLHWVTFHPRERGDAYYELAARPLTWVP